MGMFDSIFGGSESKSRSQSEQWSRSQPWNYQAPYLAQGYATAEQLFNQGGPQYYGGSTVAPFSPVTEQGMSQFYNTAAQGSPLPSQGQDYLSGVLSGGYTPNPTQGFAGLNSLASGNNAMMNNPYGYELDPQGYMLSPGAFSASAPSNMLDKVDFNKVGDVSVGNEHLQNVQGGNFLGSNPYLDSAYNSAASRVTDNFNKSVLPGLNATFGAGGRTGSGLHEQSLNNAANTLGQNLGDMANSMYSSAYQFERGNQDQAATNLMDADLAAKLGNQQTRFGAESTNANLSGTGLNAATNASIASMNAQLGAGQGNQGFFQNLALGNQGLYGDLSLGNQNAWNQGLNNMFNASNALGNHYFSGLNNMNNAVNSIPTIQNANYFDANQMMNLGNTIDAKAQDYINADKARWDFNETQPYNMLDWYMQALGAPVMTSDSYGKSTSSSSGSSTPGVLGSLSGFVPG